MRSERVAGTGPGATEWQTERLDLAAYLRQLGVHPGPAPPDIALLRRLQRAHQETLPFGNADILLGHPVRLDLDSVQDKLLVRRRGGYCHEHNLLFAAVLERLGFAVTRLSGRVRAGTSTGLRPRTHMLLRVRADDEDHLVDVGFGGTAPAEPLPLRNGAEATADGWTHRLRSGPPDGRLLQVREGGGWSDLYSFGPEPAHLVDYEVATHHTSTHPRSPFRRALRLTRASAGSRLLLQDRHLSELHPEGARPRGALDDDAFARTLTETFALNLTEHELTRLAYLTRQA